MLVQVHGRIILRALLSGFAGVAPRSATPNLIELLSIMVTKFPAESKAWMAEILYSVSHLALGVEPGAYVCFNLGMQPDFTPSQATPEAKDKFVKTVFGQVPYMFLFFGHCSHLFSYASSHGRSRSLRRTRDAAQQFTLVARGLEGSSFGYATVSM